MLWYFDGSALAKWYIREIGSPWFRQEVGQHSIIIAQVSIVEVRAAMALRLRTGSLSPFPAYKARQQYASHLNASAYLVLPLTEPIIDAASQFIFSHPLRTYDAVQLATAWIMSKELVLIERTFASSPPMTSWNERRRLRGSPQTTRIDISKPLCPAAGVMRRVGN